VIADPKPYLPPEWAEQSGIMLTWPHGRGDWGNSLADVERVFVDIARHAAARERLLISCLDDGHTQHVRALLNRAGIDPRQAALYVAPSNDIWARDHGPLTVLTDNQPHLLDFIFNGWGGKYRAELDNAITTVLHQAGAFRRGTLEHIPLVFEGGSIEVDGEGTLLTTSHCLLSPTRNPHLSRSAIEGRLAQLLGVDRFLWLDSGLLAGDDTDGHIDTLARFCDPRTIAYVSCDDAGDENYLGLRAMEQELKALHTRDGDPYHLVALPSPAPKYDAEGNRLPATYANFLIINGAVLVPTYDDPADGVALERLAGCFPGRGIVAIPCLPLITQFGSLHCATMQLPKGVL